SSSSTSDLPGTVHLPHGYHPLRDHYSLDNPDDNYDGWPRYIVSERDHMVMAYVPAQTITMGGGLDLDEVPARQVIVQHFYMDLHEVSNAQFCRFAQNARGDECTDLKSYEKFYKPGYND